MKFGMAKWFQRVGGTIASLGATSLMTASLSAGEPIQFSKDKAKPEPGIPSKLATEKASPLDRLPLLTPYDVRNGQGMLPGESRKRDPNEEKRKKLADMERKNWMAVKEGELQEKEEEETSFGIRDYDASLEKDQTAADIWFGPKQDKGKAPGRPHGPARLSRNQVGNRPAPRGDDEDKASDLSLGKVPAAKDGEPLLSGQPSKELSLQSLLGPAPADISLKGLPGSGSGGASSFDDRWGLRSIDTQPGAGVSGRGLGFNRDREASSQPAVTPLPTLIDNSTRSQPAGFPGNGSDFGRPKNAYAWPSSSPNAPSSFAPRTDSSTRSLSPLTSRPGAFGER